MVISTELPRPTGVVTVRSRPSAGGFTLIEIMVSLAILAASFIVLLGLRNRDIAIASEANHIVTGTLLARQKISDFSLAKDPSVLEKKGDFGKDYEAYQWEMAVSETGFPQLSELSVSVFWMEGERRERAAITTYFLADEKR